jgi:hypothetical protein
MGKLSRTLSICALPDAPGFASHLLELIDVLGERLTHLLNVQGDLPVATLKQIPSIKYLSSLANSQAHLSVNVVSDMLPDLELAGALTLRTDNDRSN